MFSHSKIEKSVFWLGVLTFLAVIWGGLVEIAPLLTDDEVMEASEGVKPHTPIQLAGFNIYVREGCYNCHSQMIRPFRWETERYGAYSVAGESVYDRPFQWGSKRTGPDLARIGGRYSDSWHEIHLINPRDVVPESNMPGFPWLADTPVNVELTVDSMKTLNLLGHGYTDEQIANAPKELEGKREIDAVIAYLQNLGLTRKLTR